MGNIFGKNNYTVLKNDNTRSLLYENLLEKMEKLENKLNNIEKKKSGEILQSSNNFTNLRKELNDVITDNLNNKKSIRTLNILLEKNQNKFDELNNLVNSIKDKEVFNSLYTDTDDCKNIDLSID